MARHDPGAGQYCPISRTLDVVGERWSLLILRDMMTGTTRFNDLARGLPGLSRTLLTKRLRHLERAGVVERTVMGYELTPAGRALEPVVFGLAQWGADWVFGDPQPDELDAQLLVWWMHARVDTSVLGGDRHVLHVRFSDDLRRFWILVEHGTPSVCMADPGFPVDLTISSDVASLYAVWLGRLSLPVALRSGRVQVEGTSAVTRRLGQLLRLSPVAPFVATAASAG
ncbi:winged helix-turn-helix transcriptional regulator [Terrabacter aeriphilus]|uniref:Winged helix-turn-helix transcriptional regulator n=1 Tax=Terrabacter aeriphilus TaxID=515662 RepID=A0ABP9JDD6_9MICO